jgi:hypothetical protein
MGRKKRSPKKNKKPTYKSSSKSRQIKTMKMTRWKKTRHECCSYL